MRKTCERTQAGMLTFQQEVLGVVRDKTPTRKSCTGFRTDGVLQGRTGGYQPLFGESLEVIEAKEESYSVINCKEWLG
jgi:hypothetical protein